MKRGRPKGVGNIPKVPKRRLKKADKLSGETALWGPEPTWNPTENRENANGFSHNWYNGKNYESAIGFALNWYMGNTSIEQMKKYTIDYVKLNNFPADAIGNLSNLPDRLFSSVGKLARCAMRGAKLTASHSEYLKKELKSIVKENVSLIEKPVDRPVFRKRLDEIQLGMVTEIEEFTDQFINTKKQNNLKNYKFAKTVLETKASQNQVKGVLKHFEPRLVELREALSGTDADLKEAYSNYSKPELKTLVSFYEDLEGGISVAPTVEKKPRKQRRKKVKTPEQILKKFQHKNSDASLKIQSIDPADILGANELWIFNTKTRNIGWFKAEHEVGLSVKGTSIRGYDEKLSYTKKLRKPEETIKQLMSSGKPAAKKLVEGIRAKSRLLRSRINEDIILLRAF